METMEYIGAICIGLYLAYGIRLVKERIAIRRNEKRLLRMREISDRIDGLRRNSIDYSNGALEAFLPGDLETAKQFANACNDEADSIEDLVKEYNLLRQKSTNS